MDNAISEIDYNDPMISFGIVRVLGKVIAKSKDLGFQSSYEVNCKFSDRL